MSILVYTILTLVNGLLVFAWFKFLKKFGG